MILTYVIYATDATNHHCMYRQIVSMQIHRMIMLTTTLLRANFSITFSHHSALIGKTKRNKTHKKGKYSQEAAGALRHQHRHHTLWAVASNFCQRPTAGAKQSRFGAGCSSLKNSKGNGWISLRLFITSQPCRGIQNSVIFFSWNWSRSHAKTNKWVNIYRSKHDLAIFR